MVSEIEWTGEEAKIVVCYREAYREMNADYYLRELKLKLPGRDVLEQPITDEQDGVLVSFERDPEKNGIGFTALPIGKKPERLIFHPQEQSFLAVQKVEQLIGVRNLNVTKRFVVKKVCIFDSFLWCHMDPSDLKVRQDDARTQEEMAQFSSEDDYIFLVRKLSRILAQAKKEGIVMAESESAMAIDVAVFLEGYLHKFDADQLLRKNMGTLLDPKAPTSLLKLSQPASDEDKEILVQLTDLGSNVAEDYSSQCDAAMSVYKAQAPQTEFKKKLTDNWKNYRRHYEERYFYRKAAEANSERIQDAKSIVTKGIKHMREGNYPAAKNLFTQALHYIILSCDMSNKLLVTALFNYARAHQKTGELDMALPSMEKALNLVNRFDHENRAQIEKIKGAIQECEAQKLHQDPNSAAPLVAS
jgi:hypothetical protein